MTRARAAALVPRLLALGVLAGIAMLVYSLLFSGGPGYVVYAKFTNASGLLTAYNVKVGGVTAGTIASIGLDKHDHAVVKMELNHGAYPIGAGATASIRPVNLLGEKYVDLNPGNLRQPQPSGSAIPLGRTSTPVELDNILNMLAPDTLARLQIIVNEAGVSLAGNGANFSQTLSQLPPSLDKARALVGQIAQQNAQLGRLIDAGGAVVASVNSRSGDLDNLVTSAANAMQTVAARRAQLAQTVQNAPAALAQLTHTLDDLGTTADALYPAMVQLRAAAPPLADVLAQAPSFATDANEALHAAREVAPDLTRLGAQGTPLLHRVVPTVLELSSFASSLQKVTTGLDQQGSMKALLRFIAGWAGVIGQRDGLGNVFRVHVTLSPQLVTSVLQRMTGGVAGLLPSARHAASPQHVSSAAPATTSGHGAPAAAPGGSGASPGPAAPAASGSASGSSSGAGSGSTVGGALQNLVNFLLH
jgi:virulence factor Mce-like protein